MTAQVITTFISPVIKPEMIVESLEVHLIGEIRNIKVPADE